LADFDHDGRQEMFLKNRSGPQLRLLKNVVDDLPPSISFRLRGVKSNPDAIGAAITVESQTKTLQAGSGFLSQHSKDLFFGLGSAKGPLSASIRWPSGLVQQVHDLPLDHRVWVEEGFAPVPAPNFTPTGKPELLQLAFDKKSQKLNVTEDVAAVYNILYRSMFDRHRDLTLPASFLIDAQGNIVKVYQGLVERLRVEQDFARIPQTKEQRLALALPFPGNTETYEFGRNNLSLGSAFFQRGYYEQAEASFRVALRDDPSSAEAQYGLGSVYLKQDKNAEARSSFEQALKLTASYPETVPNAWNNLGLLATREGRTSDAIAHFQEALRVSPDYWIALENLGNAYRQQRQWDDARAALERAVAGRPKDPEANYSLAMVYAQTDNTERAYQYLQRALTLRPAYPEALNNLGILYLRTRRRDEAVAKFEECISVAPGFDQSYLNLARVFALEGERDKARGVLLDLLKQHPGHSQAQQALDQLR
jgi:tetratricopeptide (TPR) repeat protein